MLLLYAHPAHSRSDVNRALRTTAEKVEGVTLHDLYATYPDSAIDVEAEQELVAAHDVLLFQHPMYWYSCPGIVKDWLDLVLQVGWAYGSGGRALEDKAWITAITTGGSLEAYSAKGINRFTIRELLRPFEQTALFCGMEFLPPFVVHGAHQCIDALSKHGDDYAALLKQLVDPSVAWSKLQERSYINRPEDAGVAR